MTAILVSSAIFIVCLLLFFYEKIDRAIIALAGAVLMVIMGLTLHFYSETQAIASIDWQTIFLLSAMMILVSMIEPTGFFHFLAIKAGQLSRGKPFLLLVLFGGVTTLISMFLNSLTAMILVAPITILICEILGLNPQVYLIAEAIFANLGGTATLIGSVPNILVASAAGLSFASFFSHSFIVVAAAWIISLGLLYLLFRKSIRSRPDQLKTLLDLRPREALKEGRKAAILVGISVLTVIGLMFSHQWGLSPALAALAGTSLALIIFRPSLSDFLKHLQWDLIVFFISLFVLVGGMEAGGVFAKAVELITANVHFLPPFFGLALLWGVALFSAIVDNVPVVIALIPVIQGLARADINPVPLYWAVIIGAGLGGNGTIIGSSVNLIAANFSRKTHQPITARSWSRAALPVTLATLVAASIIYLLLFPLFIN